MFAENDEKSSNTVTIEGVTFKTSGNIVFSDSDDNPFHLAQSSLLEKIDGFLENGMQQFLKKLKA